MQQAREQLIAVGTCFCISWTQKARSFGNWIDRLKSSRPVRLTSKGRRSIARSPSCAWARSSALPTETVYGLAADALSAEAVAKIFEPRSGRSLIR